MCKSQKNDRQTKILLSACYIIFTVRLASSMHNGLCEAIHGICVKVVFPGNPHRAFAPTDSHGRIEADCSDPICTSWLL
jgi:hypothetical protein